MHPDEGRSEELIWAQRAREATDDPIALFRKYEGLLARERQHKAREAAYKKRIQDLERAVEAAKKHQDADMRRRLASAHGSLDAYRRETKRLKEDLQRVRSSNSMRLGRAVLSPLHAVKRIARSGGSTAAATGSVSAEVKTIEDASIPVVPATPDEPRTSEIPVAERSTETLMREFEQDPSPKRFARVVNRLWFGHGSINDTADFIARNPESFAALEAGDRTLAERVMGEQRLLQRGVSVPPRAKGVAYVAEPGRVLYCVHSTPMFNSNGYSTRTRGVAAGMRANGADVVVVARPGYPWDSEADSQKPKRLRHEQHMDEVPYVHLPGLSLVDAPIDHYVQVAADGFVREARRQRPSVIQSASNHRTALPALIAARRLGVPFVYEVRGLWEVTNASSKAEWEATEQYAQMVALETLVAQEADVVLAITEQVADELIRRGVQADKIRLAPNAVDAEQFAPIPKDVAFASLKSVRVDVPVIGFAGSLVDYEGLQTLLDASEILDDRGVDHQVVIAGSGAAAGQLRAKRDERKLRSVTFLGRLPMQDIPRLLSTFDIMPIPRLSNRVTELVSPLKPLEAFSMMKPVVLSDVAPHRDLAGERSDRAVLVTPGDAKELADSLEQLIVDGDRAADLGRAARQWVVRERTWNQIGRRMLETHSIAASNYAAAAQGGPALRTLRVGLIADEFTTKTLAATVQIVPLQREGWLEQLDSDALDLVFVESAWSGNEGTWHRGVGHYSDEESADLVQLLARARELGIPSVFWNKEDPVHFDRFRRNAGLCDHVFTTDADMIPGYLTTAGAATRTASSLGFYAQPRIHNPLPSAREFRHTVAYAGTYYGDRYADRSRRLARLLSTARPYGLTIYDRQASNPDSPYRFPLEFAPYVVGSLPYDEVIDAYKSHVAHINVNSVEGSPSMFSRRVVEIAGCGGIVLSSSSRGMAETFGTAIASTDDATHWRGMLRDWSTNPVERVREAWLQMRAVYRAHTAETAIAILARTAGVPVQVEATPSYGVVLGATDSATLASLESQSVRPARAWVEGSAVQRVRAAVGSDIDIQSIDGFDATVVAYAGRVDAPIARTHFEDLLHATRFGDWEAVHYAWASEEDATSTLARPVSRGASVGLVRSTHVATIDDLTEVRPAGVELLFAPSPVAQLDRAAEVIDRPIGAKTVVVAGHDLKFARALIAHLEGEGHRVLIDQWHGHDQHDEQQSLELLAQADTVFAEWGLGNAVWYSRHLREDQRMVVRVHRQELQLPHLRRIDHSRVEAFLFVGQLIKLAAIASHGIPAAKSVVVPNFVDVDALALPKHSEAEFTLGMVGIVPQMKRLDLAVDLLRRVRESDPRFTLRIKGKQPHDYHWMRNRPEELAYYDRVYQEIETLNQVSPDSVVFDGYGDDMAEWYRKIGFAISVSDYESFHFTIADGAASGAVPVTLAWGGSEYLYPKSWIEPTVEDMAAAILRRRSEAGQSAEFIRDNYAQAKVLKELHRRVVGG
ncbi:glycosyltransferase [Agrococcus pavilionensis]|nr:glycosyltransferase [Agrococcus pavilionensis]